MGVADGGRQDLECCIVYMTSSSTYVHIKTLGSSASFYRKIPEEG